MREFLDLEKRTGFLFWVLLILLTAVSLRLYQLNNIPPGLTHDEADHGLTAVSILNGAREIYFTVGHGREPLFDYVTAGMMGLVGQTVWALRGTAVLFSLIMIGGMVAWARLAFNNRVALFTAAGLAVGFWPIMAARQGLRSITLPALFSLALFFFWRGIQKLEIGEPVLSLPKDWRLESGKLPFNSRHSPAFHFSLSTINFLLAGTLLGLTFYTYIPARGLWLLFPALLLLGGLLDRGWLWRVWPGLLLLLLVAGVLAWPLFAYLHANPLAEIRIDELSAPLTAVLQGDFSLLWGNIKGGLAIFTAVGDTAWRYNIPKRPLLGPALGVLFYAGVALALWRLVRGGKRPITVPSGKLAHAAALLWLLGGVGPVLITGPELSMTQGMGMQPVLFLFPALALDWVWQVASGRWQVVGWVGTILLIGGTAVITAHDYFGTWANAPEVRVQYESTMTAVMDYLNTQSIADVAVSTITPGQFHTPALAQLTLTNPAVQPRWFDGRGSLLVPQSDEVLVIYSGFAPLSAALEPYLATAVLQDILPLRTNDQDRPVWVYRLDSNEAMADWQTRLTPQSSQFGTMATLVGYDLSSSKLVAGGTVRLVTVWQLHAAQPGLRLFTHLVGPDGVPLAQADRLDAPSESWVAGDWLVQLHEFVVPAQTAVGQYPLTVGLYTCLDAACEQTERLPVLQNGTAVGDNLELTQLVITK